MTKAYAGDAGWRVPAAALQVHGGIGFTWEHPLHRFYKRALWLHHFGTPASKLRLLIADELLGIAVTA